MRGGYAPYIYIYILALPRANCTRNDPQQFARVAAVVSRCAQGCALWSLVPLTENVAPALAPPAAPAANMPQVSANMPQVSPARQRQSVCNWIGNWGGGLQCDSWFVHVISAFAVQPPNPISNYFGIPGFVCGNAVRA